MEEELGGGTYLAEGGRRRLGELDGDGAGAAARASGARARTGSELAGVHGNCAARRDSGGQRAAGDGEPVCKRLVETAVRRNSDGTWTHEDPVQVVPEV